MSSISKKTSSFLVKISIYLFIILCGTAMAGSNNRFWVKAQGNLEKSGVIKVRSIKKAMPGKIVIFEGIIQSMQSERAGFVLAGIEVIVSDETHYFYMSGKPAAHPAVKKNVRVKVLGQFEKEKFKAQEIRIFQYSKDRDVEIAGPLRITKNPKNDRPTYHVGSVILQLNKKYAGQISSKTLTPLNSKLPDLTKTHSEKMILDGKFKFSDNTRATDLPEEELSGASRRYLKLQTTMRTNLSRLIQAYARVEIYWRDGLNPTIPAANTTQGFEFRVRDLYLSLHDLAGLQGLQFKIGRQRFRDIRTWLMDRRLDAVQLNYHRSGLRISAAVSRSLTQNDTHSSQLHFIGSAYYRISRSFKTYFYAIKEIDQRVGRHNPLWLAVQTRGKIARSLEWWTQAAKYTSRDANVQIEGYGFDCGVIVRPLARLTGPFLSYHFAYGSADDENTEGVDERFRQPRLQLNYYKYGNQKRLYYYGGLLSPELSNLKFHAISLGYVFSKQITVQTIWRQYRQVKASTRVLSNSLGISPAGVHTNLGTSAEMVVHSRPWKSLELAISAEWFLPGTAFTTQGKNLFGLRSELMFYF